MHKLFLDVLTILQQDSFYFSSQLMQIFVSLFPIYHPLLSRVVVYSLHCLYKVTKPLSFPKQPTLSFPQNLQ